MKEVIRKLLRENLESKGFISEGLLSESDDKLAISLQSLAKHNGGKFKSDKQRDFILSQSSKINDNEWEYVSVSSYNVSSESNKTMTWRNYFTLDDIGVKKITKWSEKKGDTTQWERNAESEAKSIKLQSYREKIKLIEKEIEEKIAEYENKKNETYEKVSAENSTLKLDHFKNIWVTEWEKMINEFLNYHNPQYNIIKTKFDDIINVMSNNDVQDELIKNLQISIKNVYKAGLELYPFASHIYEMIQSKHDLKL
jgi:hypothetical protein